MINFYPGPSKVYPQIQDFMKEAFERGILNLHHRSHEFTTILKETCISLYEKLQIPFSYRIFFVSSATECWEITAQSFLDLYSFHIYSGSFGEKWLQYRKKIMPNASGFKFHFNKIPSKNRFPDPTQVEILCLTQNETSNGTQIKTSMLRKLKKYFNHSLIFVDATSSMAGIELPWNLADIWFASVQKCFGLPAGMAIIICSSRSIQKAYEINSRKYYNSLILMDEKMSEYQTVYTPNILNIFLLKKVMEIRENITQISYSIKQQAQVWYKFLIANGYKLLIENKRVRSDTVITVKEKPYFIKKIKDQARKRGIVLGNGYGQWKDNTFRIANFPSISNEERNQLKDFLINPY